MNASCAVHSAILASALLMFSGYGQESDWNRFMDAGDSEMSEQHYPQAEESYHKALMFAEGHWKKDARISATLVKLAESSNAQGKKDEAEVFANRAVVSLHDALKAHKPRDASEEYEQAGGAAAIDEKAGDIFAANQKYPEAEQLYAHEITVWERYAQKSASSHPNNEDFIRFMLQNVGVAQTKIADTHDKLGALYVREGRVEEAEREYQESQTEREKRYGADQPPVATSLLNRAACFGLQGKYSQAEPLYKRSIEILEHSKLRDKSEMAFAMENYAVLLKKTGRDAEAAAVSGRAQEIRSKLSATSN